MRSRLLRSVSPLPTIRETSEEMLPSGPGPEPPASPGLEDYVRSICQLAQPTTVLDKGTAWGRPSRPHQEVQGRERSSASSNSPWSTPPSAGTADPLAWLFRESQEKQGGTDFSWMAAPSARPWSAQRQTDSGKAGMPFKHGHQGASMQRRTSSASRCSPRSSSLLRTLCSQLPVIHELRASP